MPFTLIKDWYKRSLVAVFHFVLNAAQMNHEKKHTKKQKLTAKFSAAKQSGSSSHS
jgi:hypothetical protein